MLSSNSCCAIDYIEEVLPRIEYYHGQYYRMSPDAIDFTFALPVMDPSITNVTERLSSCLCVKCYKKPTKEWDFETVLSNMQ